jgi:hypothetical protein
VRRKPRGPFVMGDRGQLMPVHHLLDLMPDAA